MLVNFLQLLKHKSKIHDSKASLTNQGEFMINVN